MTKHPETWLSGIGSVDLSTNARLGLRDGGRAKKSKEGATQHTKDCWKESITQDPKEYMYVPNTSAGTSCKKQKNILLFHNVKVLFEKICPEMAVP